MDEILLLLREISAGSQKNDHELLDLCEKIIEQVSALQEYTVGLGRVVDNQQKQLDLLTAHFKKSVH
jgi:hypothetical protein